MRKKGSGLNGIVQALLFLVLAGSLWAQKAKAPLFYAIADKDKVYIILGETPRRFLGFNLYRKEEKGEFVKLNEVLISPILDPVAARAILSDEYEWVASALKADSESECLFKLRQPEFGIPLSLVSQRVGKVLGRIYIDDKVEAGGKYTYRVALVDYSEKEFQSAEETVQVSAHKPPVQVPQNVRAKAGDGEVTIEWEYPPYKGGKDIVVGFNIYAKGEVDKDFFKITDHPRLRQEGALSYRDVMVDNGFTYEYYLTSVDLIGVESPPSQKVSAKPMDKTPPAIPTGLDTVGEEAKISIIWDANLELDIAGYNIFKATSLQGDYVKLNQELINPDNPFYTDEAVESGKLYFYRVSAVDKVGNESKQSNAVSGSARDTTPPQAPKNLTAEVKERKVLLKWEGPPDKDLLGFFVYRGTTEKDIMRLFGNPLPKDKLSYQDEGFGKKGLVPGDSYVFAVSAVDGAYNESPRASVEVKIPDDEAPSAPISFFAHTTEDGKVEVKWQRSFSRDVDKYIIYRSEEGKEATKVAEVGKDVFRFVDDKAEKGKKYLYQMLAVDKSGNESQRTKAILVIPRDINRPPTPSNVKILLFERGVRIAWEEVKIEDLLGYNVYRSYSPSGVFEKLNPQPIKETSFEDRAGKADNYYKVTAVDTSLNESFSSLPAKPSQKEEK